MFFCLQLATRRRHKAAMPPCHPTATPPPHHGHTGIGQPAAAARGPSGRAALLPCGRGRRTLRFARHCRGSFFSASVEPQIWFATSAARCFRKPRGSSGWVGCSTKMQTTVEKNRPSPNQPCLRSQQPSHQPALFCGLAAHSRHPHREGSILGPGQVAANQFV